MPSSRKMPHAVFREQLFCSAWLPPHSLLVADINEDEGLQLCPLIGDRAQRCLNEVPKYKILTFQRPPMVPQRPTTVLKQDILCDANQCQWQTCGKHLIKQQFAPYMAQTNHDSMCGSIQCILVRGQVLVSWKTMAHDTMHLK